MTHIVATISKLTCKNLAERKAALAQCFKDYSAEERLNLCSVFSVRRREFYLEQADGRSIVTGSHHTYDSTATYELFDSPEHIWTYAVIELYFCSIMEIIYQRLESLFSQHISMIVPRL